MCKRSVFIDGIEYTPRVSQRAVGFPCKDEYFGVRHKNGIDESFSSDLYICVASDEHVVVGKRVGGSGFDCHGGFPYTFTRFKWHFREVSVSVVSANLCAGRQR